MKKTLKKAPWLALALFVLLLVSAGAGLPVASAQGFDADRVILGEHFVLTSGEILDGNLALLGGTADIEADSIVHGDVSVFGGVLTVGGTITGDVSLMGGSISLNETAVVEGNLASFAGSVDRAPGAQIRGDTFSGLRTPPQIVPAPVVPHFEVSEATPRSWISRLLGWQLGTIGSILLMSLLGIVLLLVAPRALGRVASATALQPALTFGVGFLTLMVGTFAGAILLIACGLGLLVWLVLVAAAVMGWIGVGLWLGQKMLRALKLRTSSAIGEVLAGVVVITLLARLPWCFGWLVWLICVSWGIGAVVVTRFGTQDASGPTDTGRRYPAPGAESDMPVIGVPATDSLGLPADETPPVESESSPIDLESSGQEFVAPKSTDEPAVVEPPPAAEAPHAAVETEPADSGEGSTSPVEPESQA